MQSIEHLSAEEQQHFIRCDCGEYLDMRDLSDVFRHLHAPRAVDVTWSHSVKLGEPVAYTADKKRIDLN